MTKLRPIQLYHSQAVLIWPDGPNYLGVTIKTYLPDPKPFTFYLH
jgi:hypothetical protein